MFRSFGIALVGSVALLALSVSAFAQANRGPQCTPPVQNMSLYDNCRLVSLQTGMVCRCDIRQKTAHRLSVWLASVHGAASKRNTPVASVAAAPTQPIAGLGRSDERLLTEGELRQIYSGKTWVWSDGGGYFDSSGSFFAAVGSTPTSAFLARGRWMAGHQGELCFQALWNGQIGKNAETTCFYHKVTNGNILQKKGQDGEWYTFRNARLSPKDEFRKIVIGNRISDKMSSIRSKFLYGVIM
jgi:hypothetical protein